MFADLQMFWRFAAGLRRFLAEPLSQGECKAILAASLRDRELNFLATMRRAVYANPRSPYLPLLRNAGVEFIDLETLVREQGIERALTRLRDRGVTISLDAFKGIEPIRTGGTELRVRAEDFDNPLLLREFTLLTGGSTGRRRRLNVDLDLLVFEAASQHLFLESHRLLERPLGLWRPVPPGSSGIKHALRSAKLNAPVVRWFDLSAGTARAGGLRGTPWQSAIFLKTAVWQGRRGDGGTLPLVPKPEPVPPAHPQPVLRWLAQCVTSGTPALLSCPASAAVRVARAAIEESVAIHGTVFWVGGEPLTAGKAEAIRSAGCRTVNGWSLSETGPIALGCPERDALDEVHLLDSKVAAIPAGDPEQEAGEGERVLLTTILPATPKILLNVDIGDRAVFSRRRCGCPVEQAGFAQHLHTIRAVNKLTAGGMHLPQADLLRLVEQVLPAAHGGSPLDYQFVESETGGRPQVALHVAPRLDGIDQAAVLATVAQFLSSRSRGHAMMVDQWRHAGTLTVLRTAPFVTPVGKTPPLWIQREE